MLRSCTALAPHFRVKEFAQYTRPRVKDQRAQTPAMVLQMKRISGKGGIFDTRVAVIAPCAVDDGSENYQVLLCMRNSYIGLNEVISDIGRWSSVFLCISTIAWLHRLGVMWTPFNSLFFVAFLAVTGCHGVSQPNVQLGSTTLIGKRLQASSLDFFGGYCPPILTRWLSYRSLSGIPFAEPPIGGLRLSPPRPKYSLFPLQSFDARNYGNPCLQPVGHLSSLLCPLTHSPSYSNCLRTCQRTVSPLTYSGLPALTLIRLCLSWSGFREPRS